MDSDFSFEQIVQLVASFRKNGWTKDDVTKLGQCGKKKSSDIRAFLSGEAELIVKTIPAETESDIVHVFRSQKPIYPEWMKEVLRPELEDHGPSEWSMAQIEQWLHDGQKNSKVVKGQVIYDYLVKNQMIESCLSLRDLEEIQKRGIAFFRKHFQGKAVFAWKSVVRLRNGLLLAPCLVENVGKVVLFWFWLAYDWRGLNPALRFASPQVSGSQNS